MRRARHGGGATVPRGSEPEFLKIAERMVGEQMRTASLAYRPLIREHQRHSPWFPMETVDLLQPGLFAAPDGGSDLGSFLDEESAASRGSGVSGGGAPAGAGTDGQSTFCPPRWVGESF